MRVLPTDFGRFVLGNVCRPLLSPNCQACIPASGNKKHCHPRFADRRWLFRSCQSFLAFSDVFFVKHATRRLETISVFILVCRPTLVVTFLPTSLSVIMRVLPTDFGCFVPGKVFVPFLDIFSSSITPASGNKKSSLFADRLWWLRSC